MRSRYIVIEAKNQLNFDDESSGQICVSRRAYEYKFRELERNMFSECRSAVTGDIVFDSAVCRV